MESVTKTKSDTSSGGVIYRMNGDQPEVILISHRSQGGREVWCLPKGSMEEGESLQETAVREVREETGTLGRVLEKLGEIRYQFYSKPDRKQISKTVHFYLLVYLEGDVADHDHEADEAKWFPLDEAMERLTHLNERAIFQKAADAIKAITASPPTSLPPLRHPL